MIPWRPITSGSTIPIFIRFSPNGRYLIVDYKSDPPFFNVSTDVALPWQPIWGKIAYSSFIHCTSIPKWLKNTILI